MIMGPLRPRATTGEKIVYSALGRLNGDYQIWPELPVQGESERKQPDFVLLHPLKGIIVLEVKDWRRIISANPYGVMVDGREDLEPSPVTKAKGYCEAIIDMIRETHRKAVAEGSFLGSLPRVPYAYGVVLTWQTGPEMLHLENRLKARGYLLNREDFTDRYRLEACLDRLPRPGGIQRLSEEELELVRRALFPDGDIYDRTGEYMGHFFTEQEIETKDDIFPYTQEETKPDEEASPEQPILFPGSSPSPLVPDVEKLELTEQGEKIAERFKVKLVRGVAGSGKTQILCKRAVLWSRLYPTWDILVLTRNRGLAADLERVLKDYEQIEVCNFDRLCRRQLESKELWRSPVNDTDQPGWICAICMEVPGADQFDPRFLRDEFNWMKYVGRLDRESYLTENRDGRENPLSREKQRPIVFQVFELYEERLRRFRQMTWADVPLIMIDAMEGGLIPGERYDAILVDEAQMFPPTWFTVVKRWLEKPHGMLFLAADMTQNIYARFSWKQKGLDVRGRRSRILRQPYRSSYPIARAAYELVCTDSDLQDLLSKDGDELIEPEWDHPGMRPGETPRLVHCSNLGAELHYVTTQVKRLIDAGYWPSDIAVVSLKEVQRERFASHLGAQGVPIALSSEYRYGTDGPRVLVGLISGITGQEFKAVLVCDAQDLFDRSSTAFSGSWPEFKAQQKRLLYVAMTRARDNLHICYRQKLHSTLQVLSQVTKDVDV